MTTMIPGTFNGIHGANVPRKRARLRNSQDLLTRTSWTDAQTALNQINKGKASGNRAALWLRARLQAYLFQLGCFVQLHAGKVLFVGLLALCTFCVGLKSATILTDVEKLWVEEGGRLERELNYIKNTLGEGSGSTYQMLIQTAKVENSNVLYSDALLAHLEGVKVASQVTVDMYDITWNLKDLCYAPSIPSTDTHHYINMILQNIFPCAIITPLDCFWEGSKLLGPEYPVTIPVLGTTVQWTNLNPIKLIQLMREMGNSESSTSVFKRLEAFMNRAGITSAYQEKPCLDPYDAGCPKTAPNKRSKKAVDIGAEVTGGCYGFAPKFMHWPEDLIVGGTSKNKTGHVYRAEALQTIIQLMGEKDMYEYWSDHYKVHNIDWTPGKATLVLESWQRKFKEEILRLQANSNVTKNHNVMAFTTTSLKDILKDFSQTSVTKITVGYILMLMYACLSLMRWSDPVNSQSGVGIAGVLLVAISVAAGLGFCSVIGLLFNASTTQIVPFLALGLGVDDMFLLAHTYAENSQSDIPYEEQTGECLKRTGVSILLTSLSNACAFFAAANIPIPALRAFAIQIAVLVLFNVVSILLIYPAIVSLDLRRRQANLIDVFCCFPSGMKTRVISLSPGDKGKKSKPKFKSSQIVPHSEPPKHSCIIHALPPDRNHTVTVLAEDKCPPPPPTECWNSLEGGNKSAAASVESLASIPNSASMRDLLKTAAVRQNLCRQCSRLFVWMRKKLCSWSLSRFASEMYGPFLQRSTVKASAIVTFCIVLGISVYGIMQVTDGLDLTDVVPRQTNEFRFLKAQNDYFGFYNMFAITQGNFEYPTNQQLLYDYHNSFVRVDRIIKDDDGGLPEFWLGMMRDWLLNLQKAFDADRRKGFITQERWTRNASDDGILAYKLLVQTGHVDNPVDKRLVNDSRLVIDGIINSKAFYNYLSAWATNDALAYSASQSSMMPEPRIWHHAPLDVDLKIPKSQPLVYAQMPFYLNNLGKTEDITNMISQVRGLCKKFEDKGLPNFPAGIPFTFWEQYVGLRFYLMLSLVCVLVAVFVVVMVTLFNPWAASIVVVVLTAMVIQLFGFMGFAGIRLSAVPAVILIVAVGIGVEFTAHILLGFLTSIGDRDRRICMSLEHTFAPVIHGAVSTMLGIIMLGFSEFDFIVRYFFYVLVALVLIGVFNGLLVLPVLLSLLGPPGEIIPNDDPNRIATPSPEPSPVPVPRRHSKSGSSKRVYPRRANSQLSLTTITEEPPSLQSSHEIVVHPEVIVETTTTTTMPNNNGQMPNNSQTRCENDNGSSSPSSGNSSSYSNNSHHSMQHSVTTKVTATAKVKVEVHTPLPGAVEREHSYKKKRRKEAPPPPYSSVNIDNSDERQ